MTDLITESQHSAAVRARAGRAVPAGLLARGAAGPAVALGVASRPSPAGRRGSAGPGQARVCCAGWWSAT